MFFTPSIGRDLAREQDALYGAAIGFQQIHPVVSPLEQSRTDISACGREPPPVPGEPKHFAHPWVCHRFEPLRIKGADKPIVHSNPNVSRSADTSRAAARNSSALSQPRSLGARRGIPRSTSIFASLCTANVHEAVVLHAFLDFPPLNWRVLFAVTMANSRIPQIRQPAGDGEIAPP